MVGSKRNEPGWSIGGKVLSYVGGQLKGEYSLTLLASKERTVPYIVGEYN